MHAKCWAQVNKYVCKLSISVAAKLLLKY